MAYGYTLTAAGRTLLLQLQAGNSMIISRIAVGDGEVPHSTNPATLTTLVHEVERSQATCTVPVVEADTLSFEIEYRNKWDDGTFGEDYADPTGLTEGFWLKEYAVFALDTNGNEVMLYYASLGDFPEAVARWNGRNLVSKRYPVSISIVDDDTAIQLAFPANAFITSDALETRLLHFKTDLMAEITNTGQTKITVSESEPENWQTDEWWYKAVRVREAEDGETVRELLKAVPYDPEKPYHVKVEDVTETFTNAEDGSLIVTAI